MPLPPRDIRILVVDDMVHYEKSYQEHIKPAWIFKH